MLALLLRFHAYHDHIQIERLCHSQKRRQDRHTYRSGADGLRIGKAETIQNAKVVSSPDESHSQAALDAVRQWRYRPYTVNGEPVVVMTTINVGFSLNP